MKLIYVVFLLIPFIKTQEICEPDLKVDQYPKSLISLNTKILSGIRGTKNALNTSSLEECVKSCCQDPVCNFAFLQNTAICFLISCNGGKNSCQIAVNPKKSSNDPVDYLVFVKPNLNEQNGLIESLINQEKEDLESFLSNGQSQDECTPEVSSCKQYEICRLGNMNAYQCVCPNEFGFHRIDGICREYLPNTKGCEMYIDRCPQNEECLIRNEYRKQGTCQCKIGFRRNLQTLKCEPELDNEMVKNRRRRPPVADEASVDDEESFWGTIFKELGLRSKKLDKHSTLSSTRATDPPKIFTNNLQANAGPNIDVYYPSRMCILNGSMTNFIQEKQITKWEWIKDQSSPAFGRFLGSNESPVVVYENMVEGEYKFVLKVWSSEGEFSQDFVHVFVHGSINENLPAQSPNSAQINQNMIEIELDIEPSLLSESLKIEFLNKLQNFLLLNKEFNLNDPKLVLISSRVSFVKQKSSVILELLVTDSVNTSVPRGISDDLVLGDKNRFICPSAPIVLQLRKKQKSFKNLLNSIQTIIERIQTNGIHNQTLLGTIKQFESKRNQVLDFLNVKILSIRQMTCFDDRLFDQNLNNTYSCSGHGTCDMHSRKCICNKYWMPNFSRYYFNYESDLTDGNNCEFNIPLTILVLILIGLLVYLTLKVIFKYFFYYICCCCLCCRRIRIDKQKSKRLLANSNLDESYLNDSIDLDDYDKNYKK